jgi:predicted nicotinamide N-methyase
MWAATESFLVDHQMEPPYWAFAWPGSQALARHVLDHPETVSGRRVLDFAAGCGLAAIAAVRAGAVGAVAVEVDPLAGLAITMNAEGNGVTVDVVVEDLLQGPSERVLALVGEGGLLLTGDVCYSRPMAERLIPWLRGAVRLGVEVWIADPGRAYVPEADVDLVVGYAVPVTRELEDCDVRGTRLLRLRG